MFYRVVVKPTLLHGTDCWAVKKFHAQKMHIVEMKCVVILGVIGLEMRIYKIKWVRPSWSTR